MGAITDRQEEMVAALVAAGLNATRDPAGVVPPCAWVAAPSEVRRSGFGDACSYDVAWTVYVVAGGPGDATALDELLDLMDTVNDVFSLNGAPWKPATVSPQGVVYAAYTVDLYDTVDPYDTVS